MKFYKDRRKVTVIAAKGWPIAENSIGGNRAEYGPP